MCVLVTNMFNENVVNVPVSLTEEEKNKVASRGRRGLLSILLWQIVVSLFVAGMFFLFSGQTAAFSAIAGSGCYLLPNVLFVLRLMIATTKPGGAGTGVLLVGNVVKILVASGLLWMLADMGSSNLNWFAVLVGLIAALKGFWVALLFSGGRIGKSL